MRSSRDSVFGGSSVCRSSGRAGVLAPFCLLAARTQVPTALRRGYRRGIGGWARGPIHQSRVRPAQDMFTRRVSRFFRRYASLPYRLTRVQEALGRIEQRQLAQCSDIRQAEFRVFSQWGEDGIIQYLLAQVPIERRVFVEFGVENYTESNTRFLLTNNQWSGLVIDGSAEHVDYIRRDPDLLGRQPQGRAGVRHERQHQRVAGQEWHRRRHRIAFSRHRRQRLLGVASDRHDIAAHRHLRIQQPALARLRR